MIAAMAEQPEARHLVEMLRRHYQPENRPLAGVFAPEIASPDGTRRADAIWMPTTVAGGRDQLYGHEIKVTRADLMVELADPTKADPWARYCTRWWLVVIAPELLNGLDIPDAWGVMAPPAGRRTRTMTVVKPAPKLRANDPAPGFARLAVWLLNQHTATVGRLERERNDLRRDVDKLRAELAAARVAGSRSREAERIARIIGAAEARLEGERVFFNHPADEAITAALVDHTATAEAAAAVRRDLNVLVENVSAAVEPFRLALRDLEKAAKLATDLAKGGTR